jgi:hypothetical protein
MNYNLNAGYGNAVAHALTWNTTWKTFLVINSSAWDNSRLQDLFRPDSDWVGRIFTSITSALAVCTANQWDVIFIWPWYTETVTTAGWINVNKAWVSIIGLWIWDLRPTITFTTVVWASFNVTAANTRIQNIWFICWIDNQTAMVNSNSVYSIFDTCEWTISNWTVWAAIWILTAATSDKLYVINSRFIWPAVNAWTTCAACIQHESWVDYVIQNTYFSWKMTQAILNVATVLRWIIDNNRFVIWTGTKAIAMASTSTPFITNNRINVASGTAPIVSAAWFVAWNIYSAAAWVTSWVASTF